MIIEIDKNAGFCFGVQRAIDQAEKLLAQGEELYSLGEMVHNHEEVERLNKKGMKTIGHSQLGHLAGKTVLFRSHGEPPGSYQQVQQAEINLVDASCPVVLKLQQRIKKSFDEQSRHDGQVVIYGKKDHPETIGLNGQTGFNAIVVSGPDDLEKIDFSRPVELFSQTTMPLEGYHELSATIRSRAENEVVVHDTICRQVANRLPLVACFAKRFDLVLFVSGKQSSNGRMLFNEALRNNPNSYWISSPSQIDPAWLTNIESVGISGATSTPQWLMEQVAERLTQILRKTP